MNLQKCQNINLLVCENLRGLQEFIRKCRKGIHIKSPADNAETRRNNHTK